jgi:hypothetical protein
MLRHDDREKITTGAKLHDGTVAVLIVHNKINCLDHIGMTKGRRDTEFASELFHVLLFTLCLVAFSKLLDGIQLGLASIDGCLATDGDNSSGAFAKTLVAFTVFTEISGI